MRQKTERDTRGTRLMADIGVPLSPGQIFGPLPPSLAYGAALFRLRYAALRNGVNY